MARERCRMIHGGDLTDIKLLVVAVLIEGAEQEAERVLSPTEAERQQSTLVSKADAPTSREHEVLRLLAQGLTREQIATETALSLRTVMRIITRLEEKLDAPCPFLLGMNATRLGLIP